MVRYYFLLTLCILPIFAWSLKTPSPISIPSSSSLLSSSWKDPIHQRALHDIRNQSIPIIMLEGPAGTGKTWMAVSESLQLLRLEKYDRLLFTRPYLGSGSPLGFLAGSLEKKFEPVMRPLQTYMDTWEKKTRQKVPSSRISFEPLYFMRGHTFDRTIVVADEMSNATPEEMKLLLSRLGPSSKMIFTGDPSQSDLSLSSNGWIDVLSRLQRLTPPEREDYSDILRHHQFTSQQILRHPHLHLLLQLYNI